MGIYGGSAGGQTGGGSGGAGGSGGSGGISPDILSRGGWFLSIFGAVNSAIGTYFDLQSQKIAGRSKESSLRHQQDIANINAQIADDRARGIERAGQHQVGQFTRQAGQEKSSNIASQGASGVQIGAGSAAEVIASGDILAKIDRFNIEANVARAVAVARRDARDLRNQGLLAEAKAGNVRATTDSISSFMGVNTSLLSSASSLSQEWRYAQRNQ